MNKTNELFSVEGLAVCIAGSSRGLGKGLASGFAERGAKVVISSWNAEELAEAHQELSSAGLNVYAAPSDVSDPASCQELVEETVRVYGRIDVMIFTAGVDKIKAAETYDGDEWDWILDVNLKGAYFCAKYAGLAMLEQGKGSIIMTSSVAGRAGVPGLAPYSASKGGIDQLVQTMAVEWATRGVRINAIAPGFINNFMEGVNPDPSTPYQKRVIARTPMGRRGEIAEFVGPFIFLASDASSYVTGEVLFVDGGYHAG